MSSLPWPQDRWALPSGDPALSITSQQLNVLRDHAEAGLARVAARLCQIHSPQSRAALCECHACALGSFPGDTMGSDAELIAGVLTRFDGGIAGTSLLALDPSDALRWVRAGGEGGDPIARFLELGREVMAELVSEMAGQLGTECELGPPSLQEDSVAAVLLRTHAPSDTAVISIRFELEGGGEALPASVFVLMEPKRLEYALVGS